MSHVQIAHQGIGDSFSGTYYVESCFVKKTVNNDDYTDLMLRDRSGSRNVKHWGTVKDIARGCFVFVAAQVDEYQGAPSIVAKNIEVADKPSDLSAYIPVFDNVEALAESFDELRDEIGELDKETGDNTCGMIVDAVYNGTSSFFSRFIKNPGSDGGAYGKEGGLLARVVRAGLHVSKTAELYGLAPMERSVAIAAALVHQVGGSDAYEFENCMPVKTTRGILLGVDSLSLFRLQRAVTVIGEMKNKAKENGENLVFSPDTFVRVLHAVVSTSNDGVKPMTKEAMILAGIGNLDMDVVNAMDFIENDESEDEFTAFNPAQKRSYYQG